MSDSGLRPLAVNGIHWAKGDLVVEPFDFFLSWGQILIVAGNSGCGKSTLLRHLCGLDRPDGGEIFVLSRNIGEIEVSERVQWVSQCCALMFQHGALLGSLTLLENVAFPGLGQMEDDELLLALAQEKLGEVGLEAACHNQYPAKSSGGQHKRVALARALLLDRPILLCDEPTAGLHPSACGGLDRLLRRLLSQQRATAEGQRSMIVVTHDPELIEYVGDQMLVLNRDGNVTRCIYFGKAQRASWTEEVKEILDRQYEDVG